MGMQILDALGPATVWVTMLMLGLVAAALMSHAAPRTGTRYATSPELT
jgi:hypothetical protein